MSECVTYSVKEASLILGISPSKMYQLVRNNVVPNVKLDKCYLIPIEPFNKWFSASVQGGNL